jgi:D-3-phosphoglycerate dehydrogenase
MTFRVLATDGVSHKGLEPLVTDERFDVVMIPDSSSAQFAEELSSAHGLIVRSATKVTGAMLDGAPELKAVGRAGVGVDNIDIEAASEHRVAVFNAPAGNTIAAAELAVALMLSLVRKVTEADRSMREGRWDRAKFKGSELMGKILGLIGAGRIGSEVASRCHAFGMDVIGYDPYLPEWRAEEVGIRLTTLEEVVERADIISCHVPLTERTRGMINAEMLSRMKDDAYIINAARGGVIDETDLVEALKAGTMAGAALDVYETEPLPGDSPLRSAPNLVHTPHLGASTREAQLNVAIEVADALRGAIADGDLSAALNAEKVG